MANTLKHSESTDPKALTIACVSMAKRTVCDCINQPYYKDPCDSCMEGYSERWQP